MLATTPADFAHFPRSAFFPIVVACVDGVSNVPSVFRLRRPQLRSVGPARILTQVVFPAALPKIIVGLRIALGIAWLVVVAAEMIAVDSGLGYLVIDSRNSGKRYDLVVAAMLMIGLIGLGPRYRLPPPGKNQDPFDGDFAMSLKSKIALGVFGWLVLITGLHAWLNVNWARCSE